MNRYPDPFVLRDNARALRREALSGIAFAAAIKCRTFLTEKASAAPTSDAPFPRQGPAPSHS